MHSGLHLGVIILIGVVPIKSISYLVAHELHHCAKAHMKNIIIVFLLSLNITSRSQSVKIVTDRTGRHGFLLSNKKYKGGPSDFNRVADSINRSSPGWRMPTAPELKLVFDKTLNKKIGASSYTTDNCWASDTTIGIMRGKQFELTAPSEIGQYVRSYTFFFIKPF